MNVQLNAKNSQIDFIQGKVYCDKGENPYL